MRIGQIIPMILMRKSSRMIKAIFHSLVGVIPSPDKIGPLEIIAVPWKSRNASNHVGMETLSTGRTFGGVGNIIGKCAVKVYKLILKSRK